MLYSNRFTQGLHQLRQIRSKFPFPSTYLLCRSSSVFTDNFRSRPYTIFTLADQDSGEQDSSAKVGSQLFREVALKVMSNGHTNLPKQQVLSLLQKCPDGQVKSVLGNILGLFGDDDDVIPIMTNKLVYKELKSLAKLLSSHLAVANRSVAEIVQATFLSRK